MNKPTTAIFLLLLGSCFSSPPPVEQPAPPPVVELPMADQHARIQAQAPTATTSSAAPHKVILDGVETPADWDDGDTFSVTGDDGERTRMRLFGYNTLESYGPVHRWGTWTPRELYALAKQAGEVAGSEEWSCSLRTGEGGYGRKIVDCPDLRHQLLALGLAHVFAIDNEPDSADLETQQKAIADGAGMWSKGAPAQLITSLHSLDEKPDQSQTYNRVASTTTGKAQEQPHSETYTACQEVCVGKAPPDGDGSCMVYVPFKQRYGESRADCLVME